MKRLLTISVLLILALGCFAQVTYINSPYEVTFSWNAVVCYEDSTPFDGGDVVTYELVYAEPATHDGIVSFGTTETASLFVTLPADGPWDIGVQTIVTTDGGQTVLYSGFTWLNEEGDPNPTLLHRATDRVPSRPTAFHIS